MHGATTAAFEPAPDLAITLEVTHESDAPGMDEKYRGLRRYGSGAAIRI